MKEIYDKNGHSIGTSIKNGGYTDIYDNDGHVIATTYDYEEQIKEYHKWSESIPAPPKSSKLEPLWPGSPSSPTKPEEPGCITGLVIPFIIGVFSTSLFSFIPIPDHINFDLAVFLILAFGILIGIITHCTIMSIYKKKLAKYELDYAKWQKEMKEYFKHWYRR